MNGGKREVTHPHLSGSDGKARLTSTAADDGRAGAAGREVLPADTGIGGTVRFWGRGAVPWEGELGVCPRFLAPGPDPLGVGGRVSGCPV